MTKANPFKYFNSSPEIIRYAVMLYVRYPLSLRQVEDLLAMRGIDVTFETVRYWWNRFGPLFARKIKKQRIKRGFGSKHRCHFDEMFEKVNGERCYVWRAVDHEGEVLEMVVTKKRDRKAALKLLKKFLKNHPNPDVIVTDKLCSYRAALRELGMSEKPETGRCENNRCENSHSLPGSDLLANREKVPFRRREKAMMGFRSMETLQKFASVHASIYNHFNKDRHLTSRHNFKLNRTAAYEEWRQLCAA